MGAVYALGVCRFVGGLAGFVRGGLVSGFLLAALSLTPGLSPGAAWAMGDLVRPAPDKADATKRSGATCGEASWYALTSITASGERMNPDGMTAAHLTLPLGTEVKVTNPANGRSVQLRINDRGPYVKGRLIDVSRAAAGKLGFITKGVTEVCIEQIG